MDIHIATIELYDYLTSALGARSLPRVKNRSLCGSEDLRGSLIADVTTDVAIRYIMNSGEIHWRNYFKTTTTPTCDSCLLLLLEGMPPATEYEIEELHDGDGPYFWDLK